MAVRSFRVRSFSWLGEPSPSVPTAALAIFLVPISTDVEGDPLSVSGLTDTNSILTHNNNGTYTYTPTVNYDGSASIAMGGQSGSTV
ncbi:MAG: Cadherin-like domain [Cyanobacteriota bacterium]